MISSSLHSLQQAIEDDFKARLPGYHKSRREGLCLLSALMLDCRTPNLMELASALPREITHMDDRYRYVERLLSNTHIDVDVISGGYRHALGRLFRHVCQTKSCCNRQKKGILKQARALLSLFKEGLLFLRRCCLALHKLPPLWECWKIDGW